MQNQLHLIRKRRWRKAVASIILLGGVALLIWTFAAPEALMGTWFGALLLQYFQKDAVVVAHFVSLGIALTVIFVGVLLQTNS